MDNTEKAVEILERGAVRLADLVPALRQLQDRDLVISTDEHEADRNHRHVETRAESTHRRRKDWLMFRVALVVGVAALAVCGAAGFGLIPAAPEGRKEMLAVFTHSVAIFLAYLTGKAAKSSE